MSMINAQSGAEAGGAGHHLQAFLCGTALSHPRRRRSLKPKTKYQGLIRHISVGGVMIDFNAAIPLPPHFFIEIVGFEGEHGATRVHRVGTELGARFNMPLPSDYVSRIIRAEFATVACPRARSNTCAFFPTA